MPFYSPGQVAERTGFTLDTLRYYERIGLLGEIDRTAGGRRRFTETDVGWLMMVRCLRDTGMPLTRVHRFLELCRAGDDTIPERLDVLEEHDQRIEDQIAKLREHQAQVQAKIRFYRSKVGDR